MCPDCLPRCYALCKSCQIQTLRCGVAATGAVPWTCDATLQHCARPLACPLFCCLCPCFSFSLPLPTLSQQKSVGSLSLIHQEGIAYNWLTLTLSPSPSTTKPTVSTLSRPRPRPRRRRLFPSSSPASTPSVFFFPPPLSPSTSHCTNPNNNLVLPSPLQPTRSPLFSRTCLSPPLLSHSPLSSY